LNNLHDLNEFLRVDAALGLELLEDQVEGPGRLLEPAISSRTASAWILRDLATRNPFFPRRFPIWSREKPMNFRVTICWSRRRSPSV